MMRRFLRVLPIAFSFVVLLAAAAAAEVLQASGGMLVSSRESHFVLGADGTRVELPLAAKATVTSFATVLGDRFYVAALERTASGRRLVVLEGTGGDVKVLSSPEVREAGELREPSLLVDETGLKALAWLEGSAPRRQVLRVARRVADGWQSPETVSPRGAGSQMALATTYAGKGEWILVWAAYDGNDDEILWSRFRLADGATPPMRLGEDNQVPDIVPCLLATPDGVLAAWNRYDGSKYRVHLARYDGKGWTAPTAVDGKGSLYPSLHRAAGGTLLVYKTAVPAGWTVAELDRSGNVTRTASLATSHVERPAVTATTARDVSLVWIGDDGETEGASKLKWSDARR
jgi:hypothetical protein